MLYYELYNGVCHITPCNIPNFSKSFDLIVAGLGSAGSFLALSAAKEGVSVLGIERGTCCGGMGVQGIVNGYYNGYSGGSFEKIDADVEKLRGKVYRSFFNHPDAKKIQIEQKLLSSGVHMKYHSVILGVYAENNEVFGVRALCNGQIEEFGCEFLSDSTSDGHLLRILGVKGNYGRPSDGATAPFSSVRIMRKSNNEIGRTNDDSGYINPYNDADFTRACITAHGKHLADSNPAVERFLYVAPLIGNREGMTIEGEQTLTLRDILEEKEWNNTLFCAYSDIDKHGSDRAFDNELFQDWFVISNLSTITLKIRVPLGSIVPKGWKKLLSVSRCIGIDSYASSAVRMNRDMYRLGEAAGVAVAQAIKAKKNNVLSIPYAPLRKRVEALGCFDPLPDALRGFVDRNAEKPYVEVRWLTDFDEITKKLATDCPGVAIWSCRRLGAEAVSNQLAGLLNNSNSNIRQNAAVALGLLKDRRAIPALREIVKNRSAYHYLDCRRSNQMRSVIAICLLGRLGDEEIIDSLFEILTPEEFHKEMYHAYLEPSYKLSIVPNLNSVYYQHFSFAVAALTQIAAANPKLKNNIAQHLLNAVENGSYVNRMTNDPPGSSYVIIAENLAKHCIL